MNRLMMITILALVVPVILFAQINWTEHTIDDNFNGARSVYAIDLDQDEDIDVLGAAWYADEIAWWENDGNGNFSKGIISYNFNEASSVFAIDLDDDGDIDVLGAANNADDITWWENDGNENFTEHIIDDNFNGARSVYAIDIEPDGDVDVLGAAIIAGHITWWENDGNQNFTKKTIDTNFSGAVSVYAIDMDDDEDVDVLGAAMFGYDDAISWWENDGNENFTKHVIEPDGSGRFVFAIDMDNDEDVDVLCAPAGSEISWYENDGNENFAKDTITISFHGANCVYAIDLDNDEDVDVLGTAEWDDDISWWENDGNENFTEHIIKDSTFNGASSVYAIDMDNDGDVDILGAAKVADEIVWWESDLLDYSDVGPVSIDIPPILPESTTLNPYATVANYGLHTESFPVTCTIEPGGYTKTQTIHDLTPGDTVPVTFFNEFTFASGTYTMTVYTRLGSDEYPANDTLEKVIETYVPGITEESSLIPKDFRFSTSTISRGKAHIELALPKATKVDLLVYDVAGRLTETLVSKRLSAGTHSISGSLDLPAGVYFYNLKTTSGKNMVKKFLTVE